MHILKETVHLKFLHNYILFSFSVTIAEAWGER